MSLKQLITLKFHTGIVNQIFVEKQKANTNPFMPDTASAFSGGAYGQNCINLYSVAEDGVLACWNLEV